MSTSKRRQRRLAGGKKVASAISQTSAQSGGRVINIPPPTVDASNPTVVEATPEQSDANVAPRSPSIRLTKPGEVNPRAINLSPARFQRLTGFTASQFREAASGEFMSPDRFRQLTGLTTSQFRTAAALSDEEFESTLAAGLTDTLRAREIQPQAAE